MFTVNDPGSQQAKFGDGSLAELAFIIQFTVMHFRHRAGKRYAEPGVLAILGFVRRHRR